MYETNLWLSSISLHYEQMLNDNNYNALPLGNVIELYAGRAALKNYALRA